MKSTSISDEAEAVVSARNKRALEKSAAMRKLLSDAPTFLLADGPVTAAKAALVDHLFYLVLDLIKRGDATSLKRLLDDVFPWQPVPVSEDVFFVSKNDCIHVDDSAFSSPILLYDFSTSVQPSTSSSIWEALNYLKPTGFDDLVRQCLGMVIELDGRQQGEHLESYTITALRGSIYMDYHPMDIRNAETLVHESGHNWLNYLFDHFGEPLPSRPVWFSPWRGEERPVAGIVHGIVAFSFVVRFLRSALEFIDLPAAEQTYAMSQIKSQVARLSALRSTFPEVLSHIATPKLRGIISDLYYGAFSDDA